MATLMEEWLGELRRRRIPGSWHVSPSMPSVIVEEALAKGFVDGGEEPAMAADLAELSDERDVTVRDGSLSVVVVDRDALLEEYRAVLAGGFGEGPPEAAWVASVFRETLGSSPMGQSVYESIGFPEVFRYRLLEWAPGA